MVLETLQVNDSTVILPKDVLSDLLSDPNFLRLDLDKHGHLIAVLKMGSSRVYRLLPGAKAGMKVTFKDKNKLNLDPSNLNITIKDLVPRRKGLKGAYYQSKVQIKKWKAIISLNGKKVSLGYFRTEEEAHTAWADASKNLGRR